MSMRLSVIFTGIMRRPRGTNARLILLSSAVSFSLLSGGQLKRLPVFSPARVGELCSIIRESGIGSRSLVSKR